LDFKLLIINDLRAWGPRKSLTHRGLAILPLIATLHSVSAPVAEVVATTEHELAIALAASG